MSLHTNEGRLYTDHFEEDYKWDVNVKLSNNAIAFLQQVLADQDYEPWDAGVAARIIQILESLAEERKG